MTRLPPLIDFSLTCGRQLAERCEVLVQRMEEWELRPGTVAKSPAANSNSSVQTCKRADLIERCFRALGTGEPLESVQRADELEFIGEYLLLASGVLCNFSHRYSSPLTLHKPFHPSPVMQGDHWFQA